RTPRSTSRRARPLARSTTQIAPPPAPTSGSPPTGARALSRPDCASSQATSPGSSAAASAPPAAASPSRPSGAGASPRGSPSGEYASRRSPIAHHTAAASAAAAWATPGRAITAIALRLLLALGAARALRLAGDADPLQRLEGRVLTAD